MSWKPLIAAFSVLLMAQTAPARHRIAGRVQGADARVPAGVTVGLCTMRDRSTWCDPVGVRADGSFSTPPVADGTYVVRAGPSDARATDGSIERGLEIVPVSGRDVTGVVIRTSRYTLRGKYVMRSDDSSAKWPTHMHVLAELVIGEDAYPGADGETAGAPDGAFVVQNAFGPRILRTGYMLAAGSRWWPDRVLLDGVDITDTPTDFSRHANSRLEVVFTQHPARIAGTVVDAAGRPVRGAWVRHFSADPAMWTEWASTTTPRPGEAGDGTFSMAVRPGRYLVAALPPTPYQVNPVVPPFATLAKTATAVTVEDRGRADIVVRMR